MLQSSSRSVSPEAPTKRSSSPLPTLPAPVEEFFKCVSQDGFPSSKTKSKSQPWRSHWNGPQQPTDDGKLLIAVPKICTYGTSHAIASAISELALIGADIFCRQQQSRRFMIGQIVAQYVRVGRLMGFHFILEAAECVHAFQITVIKKFAIERFLDL